MKNIETILSETGVTTTPEQLTAINEAMAANYKPVADYDKQALKLKTAEESVKTLTESLDKFKGVNPDELNTQIETLKNSQATMQKEYEAKLSDMTFNSLLDTAITAAKGKDAALIKRNLDIETLKASKNQKEDIKKALDDLAKNEMLKGLFNVSEPATRVTFPARISSQPVTKNYLDEQYKGNPYYHPN
ncbi:phage scaffolding protein [Eshraghiella crossota]|jgi:uncharacterized protein YpuA (DUF1002 family)|uniref:phage scaffolding protein n=1 Tax=Eshraghiella crossota TaxID=45851 RepID=UPI00206BC01C|nr:MAG TPA: minor structural protein [Caudoviricetes sp.]